MLFKLHFVYLNLFDKASVFWNSWASCNPKQFPLGHRLEQWCHVQDAQTKGHVQVEQYLEPLPERWMLGKIVSSGLSYFTAIPLILFSGCSLPSSFVGFPGPLWTWTVHELSFNQNPLTYLGVRKRECMNILVSRAFFLVYQERGLPFFCAWNFQDLSPCTFKRNGGHLSVSWL